MNILWSVENSTVQCHTILCSILIFNDSDVKRSILVFKSQTGGTPRRSRKSQSIFGKNIYTDNN